MLNEIGIGETQTSKDASVTVKDVRLRYTEELSYGKAVAWRGDCEDFLYRLQSTQK